MNTILNHLDDTSTSAKACAKGDQPDKSNCQGSQKKNDSTTNEYTVDKIENMSTTILKPN